jgi:Tol biopolymer transport system component
MSRALLHNITCLLIAGLATMMPAAVAAQSAPAPASTTPAPAAGKDSKDAGKWDVANPPGPSTEATINTDEGTWMSVDVSPDGKEVVFDLLGDIYLVPILGGEATALTSGVPWDEQPRYSPDGKRIAFTSDRGGGDNIWVMDRDGSHPKAVSKETFRLLNSPAWSPDGEYIAARKHFTSTRSAGAGEIWLYHRGGGGEGMQMTKRPNDQKDLGEPSFSPDGRYLYYSQDVTPGKVFQYDKDPNGEIYAILRLDRQTGDSERFVTGAGGSTRPTPSPDGSRWPSSGGCVRESVLFVADVQSGAERPVWDGLDKDMQETWAIHGTYPGIGWMPDSKAVVAWAAGKIQRIDVASGKAAVIPFHVADKRRITEAVRFPVTVAPEKFHTKMLRWVQVSPKGDRVLFQALGNIYVRGLPNGTPRRVTKQNDHFEFYPSWSRDGRSIVYTTWDDEKLGTVRVVSASGGEGRVVTPKPGHYVEPVFSPDGSKIVYRASSDGYLRSPQWSHDQGIFWVPARGGAAPVRVSRRGSSPQFGAANDRVYLVEISGDDEDERTLFSVDLDGSDERKHLKGVYFTEIALSPDEHWVAFTEKWNAYVTPFVPTGIPVDVGPGSKALPAKRVSRTAGENLHWSGDSQQLHWSLGPELFGCELRQTFDFVPGAQFLATPHRNTASTSASTFRPMSRPASWRSRGRVITMRGDANPLRRDGRRRGQSHHRRRRAFRSQGSGRRQDRRLQRQDHSAGPHRRSLAWRHGDRDRSSRSRTGCSLVAVVPG